MDMESVPKIASAAKDAGHKLQSWEDFTDPVLDRCTGFWYRLNDDGTRTIVEEPTAMF